MQPILTTALTILQQTKTDIGTFILGRRQCVSADRWIYEILIGNDLLMSSVDPVSERILSTSALQHHKEQRPLRVLVGGLGLGYTAEAALADSRVEVVRVIEKMTFVIDWMNKGLFPLSEKLSAEKRMEIVQGDVYEYLLGPATETYDLILVDVDHAPYALLSGESAPFYTVKGQRCVAQHLAPGGILGVWSAFDDDDFADVLNAVYPEGHREDVVWKDIEMPEAGYDNVLFYARASS
jgi:spermidine synthase